MGFSKYINSLEKRGIISRKPHPAIPFILAIVSLVLGIVVSYIDVDRIFSSAFFLLARLTFVFAILHLIVVKILEN